MIVEGGGKRVTALAIEWMAGLPKPLPRCFARHTFAREKT